MFPHSLPRTFFLAFVIFGLALASCSGRSADEPIRIGVIVSRTGSLASVGPDLERAAQQAVREANAAGGLVGGRRVELVVRDDRTNAMDARRVADELVNEVGVVGIVGSLASSASLAVQEVTGPAQIPQVSCCSTSVALESAQPPTDRYLFRTVASDRLQAEVLARYALEECDRLAVLHLDDAYGNPFAESIVSIFSQFASAGQRVTTPTPYDAGEAQYDEEVEQVRDQLASVGMGVRACIALVGFPDDGGKILRDWAELADRPPVLWIATDGLKDEGFPEAAGGGSVVDGVTGTAPVAQPQTEAYNDFEASFVASFGGRPGIFSAQQYDATILLMLAIEAAGTTAGDRVRDALFRVSGGDGTIIDPEGFRNGLQLLREGQSINYSGASGEVDFDELGNVVGDYELWRYELGTGFDDFRTIRASELEE